MPNSAIITKVHLFPKRPGIYQFLDSNQNILYVGKALSLRDRVSSYFQKDTTAKTKLMLSHAADVTYIETGSEFEALILEARLIKLLRPKYNIIFKDDKSYLYIYISTHEEFPKVYLARKPTDKIALLSGSSRQTLSSKKGTYFGPFPSQSTARWVLKLLRRSIPYCQQKKLGNRPCFYSHIGLCSPCPSFIAKQSEPDYSRLKKTYRRQINTLKHILEGKLPSALENLKRQMQQAALTHNFETAARFRDQWLALQEIVNTRDTSRSFLENANFYFERQKQASEKLREVLLPFFPKLPKLQRIECYDISNFGTDYAVGAQIVFVDGIPEKQLYRKYRIRLQGQNDVGMLEEMLTRRFKHTEWEYPDLFVFDGGKPQVRKVAQFFKASHTTIPHIGLAKKRERIVLLHNDNFKEITLSYKNPSLQLLQQMRDETHRFAIAYQRKRQSLTQMSEFAKLKA